MGYKTAKEQEQNETLRAAVKELGIKATFEDTQRFLATNHPEIQYTRSVLGQLRRQLGFPKYAQQHRGFKGKADALSGHVKSVYPKGKPLVDIQEIAEIPLHGDTDGHPEVKPRPHAALREEAKERSIQPSVPLGTSRSAKLVILEEVPSMSLVALSSFVKQFGGMQKIREALDAIETIAQAMKG